MGGHTYQRIGLSRFPWSEEHPLVFHVVHHGAAGELLRLGAVLAPASDRAGAAARDEEREAWGFHGAARRSMLDPVDVQAGDDRCLFLTPLCEFDGDEVDRLVRATSVSEARFAFDLGVLGRHGEVSWRPTDILHHYEAARDAGRSLEAVRRVFTLPDMDLVHRLVRLEARLLVHPGEFKEIQDEAHGILASQVTRRYSSEAGLNLSRAMYYHAVPFVPAIGRKFPQVLDSPLWPELLLEGHLPVREAAFFRGNDGIWQEVPR
jgi:hypothetical protein